jgi:hypothetical protein
MSILSGLMSLWAMLLECRYWRASITYEKMTLHSFSGSLGLDFEYDCREMEEIYSIIKKNYIM